MSALLVLGLLACQGDDPMHTSPLETTTGEATGHTGAASTPPNVLVLLADDQGLDSIGVYGLHPTPPPTPNLDALAAEGVRFDNAWAHPVCSPSRAALLTGRVGRRTGAGDTYVYLGSNQVRTDEVMIPRMLDQAVDSWATAAVGKWHLAAYNSEENVNHPLAMGFGSFTGTMSNLGDFVLQDGLDHGYHHWEQAVDGTLVKNDTYATTFEVDEAIRLIDTLPEPWFVYVAFHAPHSPFDIPPDELTPTTDADERSPKAERYPLVVEALDQEIGRLLRHVDDGGHRDDTLVIYAADNGTPADVVLPPWDPSRAKNSPFEGGIRVPMLIRGPGVQAGATTDALVHIADVFATVADTAGVGLGDEASGDLAGVTIDGASLWPLLRDPGASWQRTWLHSEKFSPNGPGPYNLDWRMTREARFKVIEVSEDAPLAVYDLDAAPVEVGPPIDVTGLPAADQALVEALIEEHQRFFEEAAERPGL